MHTFKNLKFPIYLVPGDRHVEIERTPKDITVRGPKLGQLRILDDLSVAGSNLEQRRARMLLDGYALYPLKHAIYHVRDMIKHSGKLFITTDGKLLRYTKSYRTYVNYFKIKHVQEFEDCTYIHAEDVHCAIRCDRRILASETYVGLLDIKGKGYLLYDLQDRALPRLCRVI